MAVESTRNSTVLYDLMFPCWPQDTAWSAGVCSWIHRGNAHYVRTILRRYRWYGCGWTEPLRLRSCFVVPVFGVYTPLVSEVISKTDTLRKDEQSTYAYYLKITSPISREQCHSRQTHHVHMGDGYAKGGIVQ